MVKKFKIISIFFIIALFGFFCFYNPETPSWCYEIEPSPQVPFYLLFFPSLASVLLYFFAEASFFLFLILIGLLHTQKRNYYISACLYFCLYTSLWCALYQKTIFSYTLPGGFIGIQLSLYLQRWLDLYLIGPFLTTLLLIGIIFHVGFFVSHSKKS